MRLQEPQKRSQMTTHMHKGCMTMLVNFGLCFLLLSSVMAGRPEGFLLAVFLIMLRIADRESPDTTLKTLSFLVLVVAWAAVGVMSGV